MDIEIREALPAESFGVGFLYDKIHEAEKLGKTTTGWIENVYPVLETAKKAQAEGELYILLHEGRLRGSAIINQTEPEFYKTGKWKYSGPVLVLHTLVIDPETFGLGLGSLFLRYYAKNALERGIPNLRLDTNIKNTGARNFYKKFGFNEVGTAKCDFNGIPGVELALMENLAANVAD